ncbi:large conductance mechanosensitive channel protein MscL [Eubacterium oxidoreducens]|uniref:Large-conductance mechanosensitive channel n=1 Tax=Eubacterium oxidoreducens TaxID=1732 RepID=A0A1G6BAS8_EUBOX|nr:large conductance mechanosensitive channel protein MscL [Eubacterium oxidoreducens]SDB17747.1 large conductance mechanosensitive channel [Eubacterium oxidoreducens]
MFKEFKEFALRGNMLDLAIGMIIGSAFTAIVNSVVDDIIMPLLGLFTGNIDFSNLFVSLDGNHYDSLAQAEEAGAAVIKYGSFIGYVIYFVIIAFILFLIIKGINKMIEKSKKEEAADPTTKECPYCASEIPIIAKRCPQCTTPLEGFVDPAK